MARAGHGTHISYGTSSLCFVGKQTVTLQGQGQDERETAIDAGVLCADCTGCPFSDIGKAMTECETDVRQIVADYGLGEVLTALLNLTSELVDEPDGGKHSAVWTPLMKAVQAQNEIEAGTELS